MKGLFEKRKVGEAISIWERLPEDGCVPDSCTYHGLRENGYLSKAIQVLKEAEDGGGNLDILPSLNRLGCVVGCKPNSIMYNELKANGCPPTAATYNTLVNGLCRAEKIVDASAILKEMLSNSREPDLVTYSSLIDGLDVNLYNILIHGLCSVGRIEEALNIPLAMKSCNYQALVQGVLPTVITWSILVKAVLSCAKSFNLEADYFQRA
ncbi:hypothetical protein MKW92_039794 [Papaver armeniacum]|nr:hypothetical protein MKW92_039794 [Papaver armeniacum]